MKEYKRLFILNDLNTIYLNPTLVKELGIKECIILNELKKGKGVQELISIWGNAISKSTIYRHINSLVKQGFIKRLQRTPFEVKIILQSKNLSGKGIGNRICSWCLVNTYIIEEHHFPISKVYGGTATINICPNCHKEYHMLEDEITLIEKEFNHV